ncbi:MAG: hypothetical protein F4Z55_08210 [Boseongicola sp. SB0667_bin_21]|nr:hypothetical protein [Boseongicola sp. SB0667_bin_21]
MQHIDAGAGNGGEGAAPCPDCSGFPPPVTIAPERVGYMPMPLLGWVGGLTAPPNVHVGARPARDKPSRAEITSDAVPSLDPPTEASHHLGFPSRKGFAFPLIPGGSSTL